MNKIQTHQEMLALQKQLEADLINQGKLIRADITQLKKEWDPVLHLLSGLGKVGSTVKAYPLLSLGMGVAASLLQKNMATASGGMIARVVMPFLVRSFSSGGGSILNKIVDKFRH